MVREDESPKIIYMDETLCQKRFGLFVAAILAVPLVGGSTFVALRGSEPPTQNWLALAGIVFAIIIWAFTQVANAKL